MFIVCVLQFNYDLMYDMRDKEKGAEASSGRTPDKNGRHKRVLPVVDDKDGLVTEFRPEQGEFTDSVRSVLLRSYL